MGSEEIGGGEVVVGYAAFDANSFNSTVCALWLKTLKKISSKDYKSFDGYQDAITLNIKEVNAILY